MHMLLFISGVYSQAFSIVIHSIISIFSTNNNENLLTRIRIITLKFRMHKVNEFT